MQTNPQEINKRIGFLMKTLGMNQKELAILLDVTQPAVSKYLRDRIPPPLILLKLAQAANTSVEWILTGSIPKNNAKTVAEPSVPYSLTSTLEGKISSLPTDVQLNLLKLIESIITEFEQKHRTKKR